MFCGLLCIEAAGVNVINIPEALQHPTTYAKGGLIHASAATAKVSDKKRNISNPQIRRRDGVRPIIVPFLVQQCKNFKYAPPPPPNRR